MKSKELAFFMAQKTKNDCYPLRRVAIIFLAKKFARACIYKKKFVTLHDFSYFCPFQTTWDINKKYRKQQQPTLKTIKQYIYGTFFFYTGDRY
jgi:hypothetical protein